MAENGNVTAKQQRLVLAIAQGASVPDAAMRCQVAERTAYNWMKQASVQDALEQARDEMFTEALRNLRIGMRRAMDTLARHMEANVEPTAATQLRAAQTWLELGVAVYKEDEVTAALAKLQKRLDDAGR